MGWPDLTEVMTGEGGGELIMNTDHRDQLEQIVEMHHKVDLTEVKTPLWTFLDQVVIPQPGQTREPARAVKV